MSRYRKVMKGDVAQLSGPELGVFVTSTRDDFWDDRADKRFNPKRLGQALREAETGDIAAQCALFDKLEEDPHILAVYSKRKRALLSKPLQIDPADDTPKAKAAAELCNEVIGNIVGWRAALYELLDAIGRGFACSQIVWELRSGQFVISALKWWAQRDFALSKDDPDAVRVLTEEEPVDGSALPPHQWVVHRYKARTGHLAEASLMRGIAWAWLFKHGAWRDWAIFSEGYGTPRRLGFYPRGADDAERRAVKNAALKLGRDGAAVLPDGARLEILQAQGSKGQLPFGDLMDLGDRYASKLFLGQTLTTEEGSNGARSLGEVHREVQADLTEADGEALAETIKQQICAPIVGFNIGWDAPLPKVFFLDDDDEDLLQRAQRDKILAVDLGVEMSLEQLREKYDLRKPEGDEDTLVVPRGGGSGAGSVAAAELVAAISPELSYLLAEKKRSLDWVT